MEVILHYTLYISSHMVILSNMDYIIQIIRHLGVDESHLHQYNEYSTLL